MTYYVAVTGASGFVGTNVCKTLMDAGHNVRALVRTRVPDDSCSKDVFTGFDLCDESNWRDALRNVHTVVHCAGLAHGQLAAGFSNETDAFTSINRDAAIKLGQYSLEAGVKKFVFISSVAVYGYQNSSAPVSESSVPNPDSWYGKSKLSAEIGLQELFEHSSSELIVLRPTLIYGPNCPGNFQKLVRVVKSGIPLPFSGIAGQRNFLAISNLCELIALICSHNLNLSGTYNIADDEVIDLQDILNAISAGLSAKLRLFYVPISILEGLAAMANKRTELDKVTSSYEVNSALIKNRLKWKPSTQSYDGMQAAASSFKS